MADTTTFEKETVDVLELLTLRVNDLSEQNAALIVRVNAQSALVHELDERTGIDSRINMELESSQYELYLQDCQIAELNAAISKAENFAVGITAFAQSLQAKVIELNASVEDLMAGSRIETTHQPEIRVRIGHTHTLKDGWRCDSTTVEWTGRGAVDWDSIRNNLTTAHSVGEIEANERHALALAPS